jgi:hypothetical protein
MACIIDMSVIETWPENISTQPTINEFKIFNKSGPDIENQLEIVEEYHKAIAEKPRSPLASVLSRVNVFSFLPIFGVL